MKVAILTPQKEFSRSQQLRLQGLGRAVYTDSRRPYKLAELTKLAQDAEIIAVDPDNLGGFELAPSIIPQLLAKVPSIRHLALSTTSYGYINLTLCQKRGIKVTNIPHYSSQSVAEHTIALLLGCSKRIFSCDRSSQRGEYRLEMGHEIAGKTLGIIGLGSIGQRTAELALALGMKVIAWNRTPKTMRGVEIKTLNQVLSRSDYLSLHLIDSPETAGIISATKIAKMKRGVIIINTASRELVDEQALAKALQSGAVDSYALEAEDLTRAPLGNLKNAFLFKGFGWYTQEALERNKEIWVNNIIGLARDKPMNQVN